MLGQVKTPENDFGYYQVTVLHGEEVRVLLLTPREYEVITKRTEKAVESSPDPIVVPLTWREAFYRWLCKYF